MDIEYNVGDCVYLELAHTSPYKIGKIKAFIKSNDGTVANVVFYNRAIHIFHELSKSKDDCLTNYFDSDLVFKNLSKKEKQNLKRRELFCSKRSKIVPVKFIKGKCFIYFINEAEDILNFLNKEDTFYYFASSYKRITKINEVRVGDSYQADIPPMADCSEQNGNNKKDTLLWSTHHSLSDEQISDFLQTTRFVETLPRALQCSTTNVNLVTSAVAASRDAVLFHGMNVLHQYNYDYRAAKRFLFSNCDKVNALDYLDSWSSSETKLFELGFCQYKKEFNKIRETFLPWKSHHQIVEFYYFWKTTDNYIESNGRKSETNIPSIKILKKNYLPTIPDYDNNSIYCKKCKKVLKKHGFTFSNSFNNKYHLCHGCWTFWKKYGPSIYEN